MLQIFMDLKDADKLRASMNRFMKWYGIDVAEWCRRAGITGSTLYSFIGGQSNDIKYGTLQKLAGALPGISVAMITGEIGFRDDARQDFEGVPESLKNMLRPEQLELLQSAEGLSREDIKTGSRMLKGLPREGATETTPTKSKKKS